jgi:hypothetical protein
MALTLGHGEGIQRHTHEALVLCQEVLYEPAGKHEVINLLRRPWNNYVHRSVWIVSTRFRACALCCFPHCSIPGFHHRSSKSAINSRSGFRARRSGSQWPSISPYTVDDIVGGIPRQKAGKCVFCALFGDSNRIRDQKRRHLLLHYRYATDWDHEIGYPAKNICMETDVIFGDV